MPNVFGTTQPDKTSVTGVFSQLTSENTDVATGVHAVLKQTELEEKL